MKKTAIKTIKSELESKDTFLMNFEIDKKQALIIEPMILEILSYFECKHCGACCRSNPPTVMDDELITIGKCIGNEVFEELDGNFIISVFKMPCRFLTDKGCRIHKIKPKVCHLYPLSLNLMGIVTLYLCPMGKDIQKAVEDFIKSKGLKPKYQENPEVHEMVESLMDMYEYVGYKGGDKSTMQIGLNYYFIPLFLKYLKSAPGAKRQ